LSTTTYTTVNGIILSQATDGVVHHFVPDPLGSVVMVRDAAGNTVYEAEYSPYGQVQSETGTNPSSLGYVGTLGYITDSVSSLYVRARYLLPGLGRWLTKDPLWPNEAGYGYAGCVPNRNIDPSGLQPQAPRFTIRPCNQLEKAEAKAKCKQEAPGGKLRSCIHVTVVIPVCLDWDFIGGGVHIVCQRSPFGDCSPPQHNQLRDNVNKNCKQPGPRTCDRKLMTCAELKENRRKFAACAGARGRINQTCFRGGDLGHIEGLRNTMRGFVHCNREMRDQVPPCV
jgi:RHS repeat-associated protein